MSASEALRKKVHEANIAVHRIEASYYELFHPEVYSRQEQKRIATFLKKVDYLVGKNQKKALDFGAGTGNLTGKLLAMDYQVTAVDISPEMCDILKKKYKSEIEAKKLVVVNSPIEDVSFGEGEFDLVACYSVLHHLPNYEDTLVRLCDYLKKGGVMLLDHEASPYYWSREPTILAGLLKALYFHSNPILNTLYFRVIGLRVPIVDYTLSDYWHKKKNRLDYRKIQSVFKRKQFSSITREDYYVKGTWVFNPIFTVYKHVCRPEMSCWIAKK